jgi:hypothetical protein
MGAVCRVEIVLSAVAVAVVIGDGGVKEGFLRQSDALGGEFSFLGCLDVDCDVDCDDAVEDVVGLVGVAVAVVIGDGGVKEGFLRQSDALGGEFSFLGCLDVDCDDAVEDVVGLVGVAGE